MINTGSFFFRDLGEQTHCLGNLGSPAKSFLKSYLKEKAFISFDFFLNLRILRGAPQIPLGNLNVLTFDLTR